jgi:very-short-patch-repair endonuclease
VRVVRGVRTAPPARDPATGRWVSVPEDILWGVYLAEVARWPHLRGLARQVPVLSYYLDFGRSDLRRGIEVDGLAFHGGQQAWAADHRRQRRIEAAGWRLVRYTAVEVSADPRGVLDEVNRLWGGR